MERTSEGRTVFRNDRAEQRFSRKFDSTRQRQMETIYGKVQTEFEKRAAGTGTHYLLYNLVIFYR